MDEAKLRNEVQHLIRDLGFWDYHPPDDTPVATAGQIQQIIQACRITVANAFGIIRNILMPPEWRRDKISLARPDIYGLNPRGYTAVIEVKLMAEKKKIEPWIHPNVISIGQRQWLDNWVFNSSGPGFLAIGTADTPRRLWVVPWGDWVEMEHKLHELSPDFHIKVSNLEDHWECKWITGGKWELPLYHPLLGMATESSKVDIATWKTNIYSLRFEEDKKKNV